jgi:hypothetical protein
MLRNRLPTQSRIAAVWVVLLLGAGAFAAEEEWETVQTEPILIKTRKVPGTSISEIWSEGELAAPVQEIQDLLMDYEHYSEFMPYMKESRTVGQPEPDGSRWVYTRLAFSSLVSSRDYVVLTRVEQKVNEDGSGEFRQHWKADGEKLPSRSHVVRVKVNEGSWQVTSRGPDKSFAVYRFMVDPGGWIPKFAVNMGNREGVTDTFKAVEREAQRRMNARAGAKPAPEAK